MKQVDLKELMERASNMENLTSDELVDVYCEIGAVIGLLASRDAILMALLGKSSYDKHLETLMGIQTLMFPFVLTVVATIAVQTKTWKDQAAGFSAN